MEFISLPQQVRAIVIVIIRLSGRSSSRSVDYHTFMQSFSNHS